MRVPRHVSRLVLIAVSSVALIVSACGSGDQGNDAGTGGSGSTGGAGSGLGAGGGAGSAGAGGGSPGGSRAGGGARAGAAGSGAGSGAVSGSGTVGGPHSGAASGSVGGSGSIVISDGGGPACAAKVASGAIALTSNYLAGAVIGMGGYAYAYSDGKGSASCVDSTALCGSGSTAVADMAGTIWGAGIGFNLNQAQGSATNMNPAVSATAASGTGISYSVSSLPAQGMRIVIDSGGTDYCVPIATASGVVPWASFNTKCWDNSGTYLSGAPAAATHLMFQVTADAATTPFDFCVTQVAFATGSPPPPDAGHDSGTGTGTGGCTWSGGPSTGGGELTCYYFKQGTATGGGCPNYKTFCGYCGSETGSNISGTCPNGISDTVSNISTQYFAAFPVGSFGQGKYCGMCIDITYLGKTITATVVDECATCTNSAGHIDLSLSAAAALGVGQGGATGDPTNGVSWHSVACPVSGNVVAVFNNGTSSQIYFQNVAFPVASATAGGATGNQQSGFWNFGGLVGGKSVTLTDTLGHTITGTIPTSSGGSIGAQFPLTCN